MTPARPVKGEVRKVTGTADALLEKRHLRGAINTKEPYISSWRRTTRLTLHHYLSHPEPAKPGGKLACSPVRIGTREVEQSPGRTLTNGDITRGKNGTTVRNDSRKHEPAVPHYSPRDGFGGPMTPKGQFDVGPPHLTKWALPTHHATRHSPHARLLSPRREIRTLCVASPFRNGQTRSLLKYPRTLGQSVRSMPSRHH